MKVELSALNVCLCIGAMIGVEDGEGGSEGDGGGKGAG